jgi:mono/diheme cytochrome c family protein
LIAIAKNKPAGNLTGNPIVSIVSFLPMSSPRLPALVRLISAFAISAGVAALFAADAAPAEAVPAAPSAESAAAAPDAAVPPADAARGGARGARAGAAPGRGRGSLPPLPPMPTPPFQSAEESLKTMHLPPGYRLELVVGDPIVQEPVVSVFDGNGRMYVAEMRSYMRTADSSNDGDEREPISRVSLHWSSKGDGNYDQHSVFVDNMVLPRMILPLKDSVLIQETHTGEVYEYRDTNNDGVADDKKLVHTFARAGDGNLEHQPSGLIWALDNWIYSTYNPVRIRWTPKGVISEPTASNGGQWGISQDNYGKTWVHNAGSNNGPRNFQVPIVYGAFSAPNQEMPSTAAYKEVFPLVGLGDVEPGANFLRADGTLNGTTSAAGIDIFRGDRLPADLVGDLLYGEPVGRLVRRTKIEERDGLTYIRNAYDQSDFIRSTDAYFRPVNMVTAPDGTIYITDMYRGIIQEGNWTRPGTFLRRAIDQYGIGEKAGRGRVWRLVHDSMKPGPQPKMLDETPAQLVAHLSHPNGWWRDTAQKLIILSQDKSVVPALEALARTSPNHLTRIHAIWTLEGLDALDAGLVREKLKDSDTQVRVAAIRASETLYKGGQTGFAADIVNQTKDSNPNIAIQGMLTAKLLKLPEAQLLAVQGSTTHASAGVKVLAGLLANSFGSPFGPQFTAAQRTQLERGQAIYLQLCHACHGLDGKGTPMAGKPGATIAPALAGSTNTTGHRDAIIMTILHGLTGPVEGKTYEGLMIPMGGNGDPYVADVASYIRNSFGNQASLVSVEDVARVRAANLARTTPWTIPEINARLPRPVGNRAGWKITTNRPPSAPAAAVPVVVPEDGAAPVAVSVPEAVGPATLSFTATAPVTGAWLQIELPEAAMLSDLRLSSEKSPNNYTRAYKVELSADGQVWGEPIATGNGTGALVDISFPPTSAKFVRVTHTEPPAPAVGRGGRGGGGGRGGVAPGGVGIGPGAAPGGGRGGAPGGRGGRGGVAQPPPSWTVDDVQLFTPAPSVATN